MPLLVCDWLERVFPSALCSGGPARRSRSNRTMRTKDLSEPDARDIDSMAPIAVSNSVGHTAMTSANQHCNTNKSKSKCFRNRNTHRAFQGLEQLQAQQGWARANHLKLLHDGSSVAHKGVLYGTVDAYIRNAQNSGAVV
jgi:hypothetical protein